MPTVAILSRSLITDAVIAEKLRYDIDDDGDVKIILSRRKGKDLSIYAFASAAKQGILAFNCMVARWFPSSKMPELLLICNQWNLSSRFPNACVAGPDSDGDFRVRLTYSIVCESGIHVQLVQETLQMFCVGSIAFWDDADERI